MSGLGFSERYEEILQDISFYCEDMFRQYFDFKYQHYIPGLQDIGPSQLLSQVKFKEYLDQKQNWFDSLTVQEKETMALVKTCQDDLQFNLETQEILDELVHGIYNKWASEEISLGEEDRDKKIRNEHDEMASEVNKKGVEAQIELLVDYGEWEVIDIVQEIDNRLDDQVSPSL